LGILNPNQSFLTDLSQKLRFLVCASLSSACVGLVLTLALTFVWRQLYLVTFDLDISNNDWLWSRSHNSQFFN